MPKTKRVLKYLLLITIVIISFRVALFSLKFVLGSEFPLVVVDGRSMEKTYYDGDLLLVKGVEDKNNIRLGDIIVFYQPDNREKLIVHRVVQILSNTFVAFKTKGDNVLTNPTPDPWTVSSADIIGVVWASAPAFAATVVVAIQSPVVTIFTVILLIIEFVSYSRDEEVKKSEGAGKTSL